jgi:hypothetical protein
MKLLNTILIIATSFFFISCSGDSTTMPLADISDIKVNETNTTIYSTDTPSNLTAKVSFTDGTNADLTTIATWVSSNPTLLSVTKGSIQALQNGGDTDVYITYKYLVSQKAKVKILKALDYNISLVDADANTTGTYNILAVANFEDGTNKTIVKNITWDTNNSAVVTGEGNTTQIQIILTGDTNITAKLFDDTNMTKTIIYHAE